VNPAQDYIIYEDVHEASQRQAARYLAANKILFEENDEVPISTGGSSAFHGTALSAWG
jgi:hypothetical protein